MALVKCKECGKPISTEAKQCPHCGCPTGKRDTYPTWAWVVAIFFSVAIASWRMWPSSGEAKKTNTDTTAETSAAHQQPQPAIQKKNEQLKSAKETECKKNDFDCLSSKYSSEAIQQCKPLIIEAAGSNPYEFHGGWFSEIFDTYSYRKNDPVIRYIGDKVTFTNDFGVKIKMKYECAFDTQKKKIVDFNIYRPAA
ncbi:zinc ribbon domain-containing protein [Salmonella enterica]|uniref:Zinc ribbon domain-containing protein n=2 Tax=Salmonella enterica TaxID=28901 RepID=A0A743U1F4_SALER|nr:zinc ribbon domain-containing protein [Salmonella enterica]HAC6515014.1 zinc ribbon domain-containing protein [Salmonella enterica subsp. salamae serovar 47:b:1,5]HAE2324775.1 zinc ribbon domain-containing protein [Salmonella enterica subsp. diarizonae serovar 65:(k):z]EAR7150476.1 zinc ribbon domain-containing protein [Salmonella enterica]ECP4385344.1 zinc ribbon domain-containing protein [Salmonella enterica]EII9565519.1 zinc ribbon domain-containing protein [Salmonella enterica]